ncbi:MAG: glutaredoxin family protein [Gammaproteobacteria bacterium]|nr:MAG: glutaredoxin family protein [Gammaproteobacteria bacterium]
MPATLTVYVRHGCHLCTDMVQELELLKPGLDFSYRVCDVDNDPALAECYGDRVPVLVGADTELCCYFLDRKRLHEYCRSA